LNLILGLILIELVVLFQWLSACAYRIWRVKFTIPTYCIMFNDDENFWRHSYTSQDCKFHNLVVHHSSSKKFVFVRKRVSPFYFDIIFNPETPIRKNRKIRRIGTYFNHETNPRVELKTDSGMDIYQLLLISHITYELWLITRSIKCIF